MSTQINVSVGSGGLSDKARQLQTAARQAQLEKERQQRIESEGTEQRNARLEAEGRAPDGSLLYAPSVNQPEIERRPAANRQRPTRVAHAWFQNLFEGTSNSSTGLFLRQGGPFPTNVYSTFGGTNTGSSSTSTRRYRSGSGNSQIEGPSFVRPYFPLPDNGYSWNPAYVSAYEFGAFGGWNLWAHGERTSRATALSQSADLNLILPAGGRNSVILNFAVNASYAVDITAHHVKGVATGIQNIDGSTGLPGPPPDPAPYFVAERIPGASIAIGVAIWEGEFLHGFSQPSATVYSGESFVKNTAFYCNDTSITELPVTGKLKAFMDWVNPGLSTATETLNLNPDAFAPLSYEVPILDPENKLSIINSIRLTSTAGFYGPNLTGIGTTPEVYAKLNDAYPYTDSSNIKTYENVRYKLTTDTRTGAYDPTQYPSPPGSRQYYESGLPLVYAKNFKSLPLNQLGRRAYSLNLDPERQLTPSVAGLFPAWDWDDAGYCRRRLSDLGVELP